MDPGQAQGLVHGAPGQEGAAHPPTSSSTGGGKRKTKKKQIVFPLKSTLLWSQGHS